MNTIPNHIGIIPDGNRRHAKRNQISLTQAYIWGANVALETIAWAKEVGVKHVSFFGTSNENVLRRSEKEMLSLRVGVHYFCQQVLSRKIPLHIVGDIDEIAKNLNDKKVYRKLKKSSMHSGDFVVHADVNYSGELRYELKPLFRAIRRYGISKVQKSPEKFIASAHVPPVDLVIRMGGKPRLSGFLPFQTTYAELYFREEIWADFKREIFDDALEWFKKQDRSQGA